jgi:hypothetical protein
MHPGWTAENLTLSRQATIQGTFILAKAKHGAVIAVECIDQLRRYVERFFNPPVTETVWIAREHSKSRRLAGDSLERDAVDIRSASQSRELVASLIRFADKAHRIAQLRNNLVFGTASHFLVEPGGNAYSDKKQECRARC